MNNNSSGILFESFNIQYFSQNRPLTFLHRQIQAFDDHHKFSGKQLNRMLGGRCRPEAETLHKSGQGQFGLLVGEPHAEAVSRSSAKRKISVGRQFILILGHKSVRKEFLWLVIILWIMVDGVGTDLDHLVPIQLDTTQLVAIDVHTSLQSIDWWILPPVEIIS